EHDILYRYRGRRVFPNDPHIVALEAQPGQGRVGHHAAVHPTVRGGVEGGEPQGVLPRYGHAHRSRGGPVPLENVARGRAVAVDIKVEPCPTLRLKAPVRAYLLLRLELYVGIVPLVKIVVVRNDIPEGEAVALDV